MRTPLTQNGFLFTVKVDNFVVPLGGGKMKRRLMIPSFALLLAFSIFSCKQIPTESSAPNEFTGTWVYQRSEEGLTVMKNSAGLDSNNYGFIIFSDHRFVERKNVGWCGTPPIVYGNYAGKWKKEADNVLNINVGYWGGETSYKMEIVLLASTELKLKLVFNTND